MNNWQKFLDSLATRGGAIFVLLFLTMVGIGIVGLVVWRAPGNEKVWVFASGFVTGFASALTLALKGGDHEQTGAPADPAQKR